MSDSQVWLITGASRGMGAAFTSAVLAAGHSVVATGRRPAEIAEAFEPSESSERVLAVTLDVELEDDIESHRRLSASLTFDE